MANSLEGNPVGRECGVTLRPAVCGTNADFIIKKVWISLTLFIYSDFNWQPSREDIGLGMVSAGIFGKRRYWMMEYYIS